MAATEKISITIGRDELSRAKRLASKMGMSLSGFVTEAVRERIVEQARREAARAVLATFDPEDRASDEEMRELIERWGTSDRKQSRPRAKRSPQRGRKTRKR